MKYSSVLGGIDTTIVRYLHELKRVLRHLGDEEPRLLDGGGIDGPLNHAAPVAVGGHGDAGLGQHLR